MPLPGTDFVYHSPARAEALGSPTAMADLPRGLYFPLPRRLARDRFATQHLSRSNGGRQGRGASPQPMLTSTAFAPSKILPTGSSCAWPQRRLRLRLRRLPRRETGGAPCARALSARANRLPSTHAPAHRARPFHSLINQRAELLGSLPSGAGPGPREGGVKMWSHPPLVI